MTRPRDQGPLRPGNLCPHHHPYKQGRQPAYGEVLLCSVDSPAAGMCMGMGAAGGWRLGLPRLLSRFCPLREGGTKGHGSPPDKDTRAR